MEFDLYSEYRYAGKNSAWAVIIPFDVQENQVRVIHMSVSAKLKTMNIEKIDSMVSSSLINENTDITLVKQKEIEPVVCDKLVEILESNGGHLSQDDFQSELEKVRGSID